ncbi:MAG TPA: hypothetical protein VFU21_24635 [Kofleriaceae bacterium]|nr:hypothetical protein [Kofleriaceae bacterium]
MRRRFAWGLFVTLIAAAACGGDDGGSTDLEGIFELASWTHNPDDCGGEGPAAAEEGFYSHFFVRHDSFFGEEWVAAVTCEDLETCRTEAADEDTIYLGGFAFDSGDDDAGWTGASLVLSIGDTSCTGSVFEATLTGTAGESVRIEEETKTVTDVPLGAEGDCDSEAAYQQAAGLPCEQLTVVVGTYLEGI